jgi:hypothetical protein
MIELMQLPAQILVDFLAFEWSFYFLTSALVF